jgi:hypothetical protein
LFWVFLVVLGVLGEKASVLMFLALALRIGLAVPPEAAFVVYRKN